MEVENYISGLSLKPVARVTFENREEHDVFCSAAPILSREGWRHQRTIYPDSFPYVGPKLFKADSYPRTVNVRYGVLALTLESLGADVQDSQTSWLSEGQKTIGRDVCVKIIEHFASLAPGIAP